VAAAPSPAARADTNGGERTRERILDAALRLFAEHSFAGTSLQMIADELGITKAAVYYYFHTREELLGALAEPALTEMRAVIEAAAAQRTPNARAEQMLTRFVDLALRHRQLTAMLAADQAIVHLFRTQGHYAELVERPLALLAGSIPEPAGRINAVLVLAGIASATGGELVGDLDDDTLRRHLVHAGRRILGLRSPRTDASLPAP
jgi:AcrR family transcriptional regulator